MVDDEIDDTNPEQPESEAAKSHYDAIFYAQYLVELSIPVMNPERLTQQYSRDRQGLLWSWNVQRQ